MSPHASSHLNFNSKTVVKPQTLTQACHLDETRNCPLQPFALISGMPFFNNKERMKR